MDKRKVYLSPVFGRKIKKLKKQEKKELDDAVLDIINDPSIGEVKIGDLTGVLVYKFKTNKNLTLLSYSYDSTEINLLSFSSHENFYRDLKKYKRA